MIDIPSETAAVTTPQGHRIIGTLIEEYVDPEGMVEYHFDGPGAEPFDMAVPVWVVTNVKRLSEFLWPEERDESETA